MPWKVIKKWWLAKMTPERKKYLEDGAMANRKTDRPKEPAKPKDPPSGDIKAGPG